MKIFEMYVWNDEKAYIYYKNIYAKSYSEAVDIAYRIGEKFFFEDWYIL